MSLPRELAELQKQILGYARSYNLDFYEVIFELLDYRKMNEVASYGGFPCRYPHWRFGMEYEHMKKGYAYGLQKIYEMVINNDPCYAYLLECNQLVDQKIVMAHVYAHSDFFKNNMWFSHTNRKMVDEMANHATHVRRHIDRYGLEVVEDFIDLCLSLEDLIDIHAPFIRREPKRGFAKSDERLAPKKLRSKDYMNDYINPPEFLEQQQQRLDEDARKSRCFPEEPVKDVLRFLTDHAPLEDWQQNILSIIREEAYYYAPQGQTKIMNEGWATYWHSKIMTERALCDAEIIDYADHHSGTVATQPGRLNPYKLGLELFKDIEERWNTGRFGSEYDSCDDLKRKLAWNRNLDQGREKIFEIRRFHNDVTFIDEFLTEEFAARHKLFTYAYNRKSGAYQIANRGFLEIKRRLLQQLTNLGRPIIHVRDGNYENRGELLLKHLHEGVDLRDDYARATLQNLQKLWKRPVHLETVAEEKGKILSVNGKELSEAEVSVESIA
ncbi:MAG: SpoVR family protein [Acidobacteriota bacterium]